MGRDSQMPLVLPPGPFGPQLPRQEGRQAAEAWPTAASSRKGARNGDRSARSLENDDYEESMLGQDRDGGSLERDRDFSFMTFFSCMFVLGPVGDFFDHSLPGGEVAILRNRDP